MPSFFVLASSSQTVCVLECGHAEWRLETSNLQFRTSCRSIEILSRLWHFQFPCPDFRTHESAVQHHLQCRFLRSPAQSKRRSAVHRAKLRSPCMPRHSRGTTWWTVEGLTLLRRALYTRDGAWRRSLNFIIFLKLRCHKDLCARTAFARKI